jgi:hypothetical protein
MTMMPFTDEIKQLIFGLDIGGIGVSADDTVLIFLVKMQRYGHDPFMGKNAVGKAYYRMRICYIFPKGMPAPQKYDKVEYFYRKIKNGYAKALPELKSPLEPYLVIDRIGLGGPHFDAYVERGLNVYGIHASGEGSTVNRTGRAWSVPDVDLTSALTILTENDRLHIPHSIPHRAKIIKQLANFTWKQKPSGTMTSENLRPGDGDDIVSALKVAAWYGEFGIRELITDGFDRGKLGL